jgi:hypothetical protein
MQYITSGELAPFSLSSQNDAKTSKVYVAAHSIMN